MTLTLEQRVQALESGELERLRGLAARRLERLRQERAAVADLRERLELANEETDKVRQRLVDQAMSFGDTVATLRAAVSAAPGDSVSEVIAAAVKVIGELSDARSHLKDALEELAEANAKLAKPATQPTLLAWDIVTTLNVLARHMSDRGWVLSFRYHDNQWHALAGGNVGRGGNPSEAVNALWKAIK